MKGMLGRWGAGMGWLVLAAMLGAFLLLVPPRLVETLDRVERWGIGWWWAYVIVLAIGGIAFAGGTGWIVVRLLLASRRKRATRERRDAAPSALTWEQQKREFDENLQRVDDLTRDERVGTTVRERIDPERERLESKRRSRALEIVAFGTVSSGKSSLLNLLAGREVFDTDPRGGTTVRRNEVRWPGDDRVVLVDTPGLAEVGGEQHGAIAAEAARDADLVLLVVDGPMRDHEAALLRELIRMEKRLVVCLNKADWYSEVEREKLLGQLRGQIETLGGGVEALAVRAQAGTRLRVRTTATGESVEENVEVPPDIEALSTWMLRVVSQEGDRLLLANLLLRSRGLVERAKGEVSRALDERAWEIVDRAMWGAGSAAALSPFPVVDLIAGCAISTKLVVDLAKVYRQDVDADVAMQLLGQLGKNLIGILGTSLAAPTVATLASQLFKTVPGVGTIAGGLLQGVVQALLTRWIGSVFIEYFRSDMQRPEGGLPGLARRHWDRLTRPEELKLLWKMAQRRLGSEEKQ